MGGSQSKDECGPLVSHHRDVVAEGALSHVKRSGGARAAISSEQIDARGLGARVRRGSRSAEPTGDGHALHTLGLGHFKPKEADVAARIVSAIRATTFLFTDMDTDQLSEVANAMAETHVAPGEVVIQQGDAGEYFYVIESGEFVAEKDRHIVYAYHGHGSFGELALLHDAPRAATVRALSPGTLWRLDRRTFRRIIVISNAMRRSRNVELLGQIPAWEGLLTMQQRQSIADCLSWEIFQDGQYIIREGETTTDKSKFYILDKGAVKCYRTINGDKVLVKDMKAPGYFGEMAFIVQSSQRFADVVAVGEVQVLAMEKGAFERLTGPLTRQLERDVEQMRQVVESFSV